MDLARESIINTQQQRKLSFGMLRSYQHCCQSYRKFKKVVGPSVVLECMIARGNN